MKRKFSLFLALMLMFSLFVSMSAYASTDDFCIYEDSDGTAHAEGYSTSNGKGFVLSVQLINNGYEKVDWYTLGFCAQDEDENILSLYDEDKNLVEVLYITHQHTYASGRHALSWDSYVKCDTKIKYLYCWVDGYHTQDGTIQISEPDIHRWQLY